MRTRPSGAPSDDIEAVSLARTEAEALPILRNIASRWPLSGDEKVKVAAYIGILLVRGPGWFEWHDHFVSSSFRRHLELGDFRAKSQEHGVSEEEIFRAHVDSETGATRKLLKMIELGTHAGSSLGSMAWTLLSFDSPALGLADHPIVVWPMDSGSRKPAPAHPAVVGLANFLEARLPLAPNLALLMTWSDRPDTPAPVRCGTHHAKNLNSFTAASAQRHWIHLPGRRPRLGPGPWLPLSCELVGDYSLEAASTSDIRSRVYDDLITRGRKRPREVQIVHVSNPAQPQAA